MDKELKKISTDLIVEVKENQPRKRVNTDLLEASIKEQGLINPIIVVRVSDTDPQQYRLIDGHRRLSAVRSLGIEELACIVEPSEQSAHEAMQSLALNVQREQLTEWEINEHLQTQLLYVEPKIIAAAAGISEEKVRKYVAGAKVAQNIESEKQTELWQLEFIAEYELNDEEAAIVLNASSSYDRGVTKIKHKKSFERSIGEYQKLAEKINAQIFESCDAVKETYEGAKWVDSVYLDMYDDSDLEDLCEHKHAIAPDDYQIDRVSIYCLEYELHDDYEEESEVETNEEFDEFCEVYPIIETALNNFNDYLGRHEFETRAVVNSPVMDLFVRYIVEDGVPQAAFSESSIVKNRRGFYDLIKCIFACETKSIVEICNQRISFGARLYRLPTCFSDEHCFAREVLEICKAWEIGPAEDLDKAIDYIVKINKSDTEED